MAATVRVRRAAADDAAQLAALRWEFRSVGHGAPSESRDVFVERCTQWMRARLAPESAWSVWVAEDHERIVGQIWVQLFEKLPNPSVERERHAYISNLFVAPSARGGVGTALLQACLSFLEKQSVDTVLLWPSAASRSLYVRHGFEATGDLLVRSGR